MLDVMIDFETLDNVPTSQILTFGAVKFDPTNPALPMEEFYVRCDLPSQAAIGLTKLTQYGCYDRFSNAFYIWAFASE